MKILAIHNGGLDAKSASMIDIWRIWRPIRELKKHVDWQIDEQPAYIMGLDKYGSSKDFTEEELEKAAQTLGQYDVVWGSYHFSPMIFALCQIVSKKYGTKFILDCDDDIYNIKEDNFGWWTKVNKEQTRHVQTMVELSPYISTSTPTLTKLFTEKRAEKGQIFTIPNLISKDYKHPKFDNGERVVIGYFGGASHHYDLHETGFTEGLVRLMHENKNIHFVTAGIPIEDYIPRGRYTYVPGERGHGWYKKVFPTLNYDISCAPLQDDIFATGKSDIKWQESSMIPSAFVCSAVGPYKEIKHGLYAHQVKNTAESWYEGLKKLVEDTAYRNSLKHNSSELVKGRFIEDNWRVVKEMFEQCKS